MNRVRARWQAVRKRPLGAYWRRFLWSVELRGWRRSLRLGAVYLGHYWRHGYTPAGIDLERGVDTGGLGFGGEILGEAEGRLQYEATQEGRFAAMMAHLDIVHRDFTFVDLGSGRGRVLLMAADYPFRAVIGVEHSRELHEAAEHNLRRDRFRHRRKAGSVGSVWADATAWEFPAGPLVVFLYNPFQGRPLETVAARLRAALRAEPREAFLIYNNPQGREVWEGGADFAIVGEGVGYRVYRWPG